MGGCEQIRPLQSGEHTLQQRQLKRVSVVHVSCHCLLFSHLALRFWLPGQLAAASIEPFGRMRLHVHPCADATLDGTPTPNAVACRTN